MIIKVITNNGIKQIRVSRQLEILIEKETRHYGRSKTLRKYLKENPTAYERTNNHI